MPLTKPRMSEHLRGDDTIGDLLGHPAFAGFARRILPFDGVMPDPGLRLDRFGELLPYHGAVDPPTVLAGLNRMIDHAARDERVFYDIYAEQERAVNPRLADTGLFFFRGRPGAPFAVISPGGGFSYVGSVHEGFPYATRISDLGLNAFVLKYRAGLGQAVATEDLARAVSFIFEQADALGVARAGYSLWGSSAGARMAASIGSYGVENFGGGSHPKPAAVIFAYSGHSDIAADEPPVFIVAGGRDRIAPAALMERRAAALRRQSAIVEFRLFEELGHGFGAGVGTSAEGWVEEAVAFWRRVVR